MSRHLKSIFTVSLGTLGSRLFGLLRDVAMAAFLGISAASNAFIFAFTVPNLFRRLLGEGALTSAFVPVLSKIVSGSSEADAFAFINRVLTRLLVTTLALGLLLAAIYLAGYAYLHSLPAPAMADISPVTAPATAPADGAAVMTAADIVPVTATADGAPITAPADTAPAMMLADTPPAHWTTDSKMIEQWMLGMLLGVVLLPYLPMVCLAAILAAALNVKGHFAVPAASPLLLNLCMIAALLFGGLSLGMEGTSLALFLSVGALAGGFLQLLAPAIVLCRTGWRPRLDFSAAEHMGLLWKLFLPGVLGAAALQINVLVSRVLAFGLNDTATTTLNYVNRLIELPLGLFAISIATVVFPQMSLHLAAGRTQDYHKSFGQGLRLTLAITLPATVGLIALAEPVLTLLFRWGRFSAEDVSLMVPLLVIASLGIPFYAASTFLTRAYHARQDTATPARIAVAVLGANLVLCLLLMRHYEAAGLAAANTAAAALQVALLAFGLRRERIDTGTATLSKALFQAAACSLLMALAVTFGHYLLGQFITEPKAAALLACLLLVPLGALIYGALLWLTGFEDRHAIAEIFRRKLR